MATIKPAPHVSAIRGSLDNATYSANRLGPYLKERKAPRNQRTSRQVTQRANYAYAVSRWRTGLSEAQRIAWNDLALLTNWINPAGMAYSPSGFQVFMRQALFLLAHGSHVIETAPASAAIPATTTTYSFLAPGNILTVTRDPAYASKNGYLGFSLTEPLSAGRYSPPTYFPLTHTEQVFSFTDPLVNFMLFEDLPCPANTVRFLRMVFAVPSGSGWAVSWPQVTRLITP